MSTKVIVGAFWGDEAKGKVTDHFAKHADIVVRFAGGNNAGHTLLYNGEKVILKLVPSGILQEHTHCVLGQGMVINPVILYNEVKTLENLGLSVMDRLHISERAHVILPSHIANDSGSLSTKIGTTNRGIGPTYSDKVSRKGIRLIDICQMTNEQIKSLFLESEIVSEEQAKSLDEFEKALDFISNLLDDTSYFLNSSIEKGMDVILEGAQGTLLDIDHGTYPYVTSSNCIAGGACTGAGIGPMCITDIIGVSKAYVTRVGEGPFPTEMKGLNGSEDYKLATWLREAGGEYGSVTGRPRRVGWLDLPALRYAKQINGLTELVISKLDVLSGLKEIKICTHYENSESKIDRFPISILDKFVPVYDTLPGWNENIRNVKHYSDLPSNARNYIQYIEDSLALKVSWVSVGPETDSIILKTNQLPLYEI